MERLTETRYGAAALLKCRICTEPKIAESCASCDDTYLAIVRLAKYEATGYSPEDFDKLCREMSDLRMALGLDTYGDLRKAMENKYLLITPRPGTKLYEIDGEHGIVTHTVTDAHWMVNTIAVDDKGMEWADFYTAEDIDTAYSTRQVAEATLDSGYIITEG